ncbi:nucleotide-binding universal stress UspA family protein [Paenibacillus phyllosphaerae]|uniref:Nucleotide-binding universal stress UspA family protein n=1 Tax=Paenibacillus phyllosphaerae TaxID=274593 RepID=A0A7W5FR26_9BACL|nr:universal stress protein [Paenibacillus phyllosphaerae]MBB3113847.1 nucleotide-binding universal stress UspA family protein [Paenibacillus phyllosphaerae]
MLFSHAVVAFDGSVQSWKALEYAVHLAENGQAESLSVVHVYSFPYLAVPDAVVYAPAELQKEMYDQASVLIDEAAKRIEHLPNARTELMQGSPAQSLLEYADKHQASLIVIGSRGLGGIREFMMGSVSHNVVQHSAVPVLVVK